MNFIDVIQISLCGRCSLSCIMCGQPKENIFMDEFILKKLNEDLLRFENPPILALAVRGEPLSHPFFRKAIKILSKTDSNKYPFRELYIDSNGKHLNYENSMTLINLAQRSKKFIRLTISMDGATEKTYSKIRRGGNFTQLLKNCEFFLSLRDKMNMKYPALNFQFIVMEENIEEVDEFKNLIENMFKKYGIIPVITGKYPENNLDSISYVFHHPLIPDKNNLKFSKELHEKILKKFNITLPGGTEREDKICVWPFYMIVIRENGNVIPCCLDTKNEMIMGNIGETNLNDILKGDHFSKFRLDHIKFKENLPQKCQKCKDQLIIERPDKKIEFFLNSINNF